MKNIRKHFEYEVLNQLKVESYFYSIKRGLLHYDSLINCWAVACSMVSISWLKDRRFMSYGMQKDSLIILLTEWSNNLTGSFFIASNVRSIERRFKQIATNNKRVIHGGHGNQNARKYDKNVKPGKQSPIDINEASPIVRQYVINELLKVYSKSKKMNYEVNEDII